MTDELNWRVEEACRAAWPAAIEEALPGWVMRRSGGSIRRANSANPTPGWALPAGEMLDRAEAFYRGFGQTPMVRLLTFADGASTECDRRGYSLHGETCTLLADISEAEPVDIGDVALTPEVSAEWLDLRANVGSDGPIFADMLASIAIPKVFAQCLAEGRVASIAYGAIHRNLLVVEAVATEPALRNRGLAKQTVRALLCWARRRGAAQACLQVVADNAPARSVYAALGFTHELYRYHYRYGPAAA